MADTLADLSRQIAQAKDLHSVVRTLKALAGSRLAQYDRSESSLEDYNHFVRLALGLYLRSYIPIPESYRPSLHKPANTALIIGFGSDQGLVGKFNDTMLAHIIDYTKGMNDYLIWTVGERLADALIMNGQPPDRVFAVPSSIHGISHLVTDLLEGIEDQLSQGCLSELHLLYHNHIAGAQYEPAAQKLFPPDEQWYNQLTQEHWTTHLPPQLIDPNPSAFLDVLSLHLYISIFRICVESFASENASRLEAMQRADRNINDMMQSLNDTLNQVRQNSIDAELFDVVSGYEAQDKEK